MLSILFMISRFSWKMRTNNYCYTLNLSLKTLLWVKDPHFLLVSDLQDKSTVSKILETIKPNSNFFFS